VHCGHPSNAKTILINLTDDGTRLTIWVRAELNAGLVAAAIPPLKSLFENVLRNVFGVRSQLRSTTGYATKSKNLGGTSRRSRARDLEDDEIAMRSHAAHVYSGSDSQTGMAGGGGGGGGGSRREDSHDSGSGVWEGKDGVTKTVSYSVRRESSFQGLR
jgi:hypothetical protein